MRWFKHFTDNHRGRTVQRLLDEVGHSGALAYYFIMEICAEKLEKNKSNSVTENDCIFVFNRKVIQNVTRMKWKSIQFVMTIGAECGVWEWKANQNEIEIKLPILLDLLDRDLKGARSRRGQDAQKPRPELESDIDKESDKEYIDQNKFDRKLDFKKLYQKYPRKIGKEKGLKACKTQVKTESDFQNLSLAIDNYATYCKQNIESEKFIKHFSSFMNCWRDWIDPETGNGNQSFTKEDPYDLTAWAKKEGEAS